jgi:HK97 family phage major capsid protein
MRFTVNRTHLLWAIAAVLVVAIAASLLGHPLIPADWLGAIGGAGFLPFAGEVRSIADQITAFEAKRTEAQNKMDAIMAKAADEGRTLDEAETEEYDDTKKDLESIDNHIARLKEHEKSQVARAKAVDANAGRGEGAPRGVAVVPGGVISVRRNLPKGTGFTRFVMAMAASKGNMMQAERLAEQFKDTPEVGSVIKALSYLGATSGDDIAMKSAIAAGTTSDTTWAGPLVQYQDMQGEFIELLRPMTILGRLNNLRRVPFNVRLPRQTSGASSQFVGEGAPAPVNKPGFDNVTLPWAKASTIVVITAELARMSNPAAESLVRQDMLDGCAQYLDKRLVDPAYAGVANVSPASLTNGVSAQQASGATLAAIDADVRAVMTTFANAEHNLATGVWIMSAATAIRLSMMRTNQDFKAFPDLSLKGGEFYGLPVIVSNNNTGSGSPGDQFLILVDQAEVLLADDGQMLIDVSTEASVQMNDAPSAGAQSLVSLWQNGLLGVKVDRWIYWTKRRSTAVQFIDAAQRYGS